MSAWRFQAPNPITNFVVGIEFAGSIPYPTLKAIAALHPQVKRELPRRTEQPTFTFQFPGFPTIQAPGRPSLPAQQQIGSVSFDRIKEDGTVSQALVAGPNIVTYMTQSYSRWEEFQPTSDRLVRMMAEPVIRDVNATAVLLTAVNTFTCAGADGEADLTRLLNQASLYFPRQMLTNPDHCHSFFGYLVKIKEPVAANYIRNVNINTADGPENERVVTIALSHRAILNSQVGPDQNMFGGDGSYAGVFLDLCNYMHDENKALFMDLVNPYITANIPGLP